MRANKKLSHFGPCSPSPYVNMVGSVGKAFPLIAQESTCIICPGAWSNPVSSGHIISTPSVVPYCSLAAVGGGSCADTRAKCLRIGCESYPFLLHASSESIKGPMNRLQVEVRPTSWTVVPASASLSFLDAFEQPFNQSGVW